MYTHKDASQTLIQAVETLSNISELELDQSMGICEEEELLIQQMPLSFRSVRWFHRNDSEETIKIIKDTFRTVLSFLTQFYSKNYPFKDPNTVESIKNIMVLVGEAAKKLDKYIKLQKNNENSTVTELKEYKAFHEFYYRKVAHKIDEGLLGKWILALTQHALPRHPKKVTPVDHRTKLLRTHERVIIDLESVKKDKEYELFFLRKEDGSRFFSNKLLRNIKLLCDFGEFFGQKKEKDPLFDIEEFQQKYLCLFALSIKEKMISLMNNFYFEVKKHKDNELVESISKMFLALMMSSRLQSAKNSLGKTNCQYFKDFLSFLREIVNNVTYKKMLAYPPRKTNKIANCILEVISKLCSLLYLSRGGMSALKPLIYTFLKEAKFYEKEASDDTVTSYLDEMKKDFSSVKAYMKYHRGGPLNKILEALHEPVLYGYDPLFFFNLPAQLYKLNLSNGKQAVHLRLPTPTSQEFIYKVNIANEFKAFLHAFQKNQNDKILIINLQDRTSIREHARCIALEELQSNPGFDSFLTVATLNKDGDFYHQRAEYVHENNVSDFLNSFQEQVLEESAGFYYPHHLREKIKEFTCSCLKAIHKVFYGEKNVLSRQNRLDFIEIFYLFFQLKLLELTEADIFTLTCKDCIDNGALAAVQLLLFILILKEQIPSAQELERINTMIYGNCLLLRERAPLVERFNRMIYVLKAVESVQNIMGTKEFAEAIAAHFDSLFAQPLLSTEIEYMI